MTKLLAGLLQGSMMSAGALLMATSAHAQQPSPARTPIVHETYRLPAGGLRYHVPRESESPFVVRSIDPEDGAKLSFRDGLIRYGIMTYRPSRLTRRWQPYDGFGHRNGLLAGAIVQIPLGPNSE